MKLSTALSKLDRLGFNVTKEAFGESNFYKFTTSGRSYEFINQPDVNDQVGGFCRVFLNGENPSYYNSFNHMIKFAVGF